MVSQRRFIEIRVLMVLVGSFLIACAVVGCRGGGQGKVDGRDGKGGATATDEETTASRAARQRAGLDVKTVPVPGQAYLPAGFGEDSLWATPVPAKSLLMRLDPRTGVEEEAIPLKGFSPNINITVVAVGAGSVWVSSGDYYPGPVGRRLPGDVVLRIDPETNRVVDRIPVDSPCGLAFGHGSVWATSAEHGTVSRIDPRTGEVAAEIKVGRGAVDIAADERSGAVWVAGLYLPKDYGGYDSPEASEDNKLSRLDPETNRVVAEIPIAAGSPDGGAQSVAVGKGAVWAQSGDGRLFKVDPATNEVVAVVPLGDYSADLVVTGGAVWATVQDSTATRLIRVDPRTEHVVASEDLGPVDRVGFGRLVAGGGYVWFTSGAGKVALARVAP